MSAAHTPGPGGALSIPMQSVKLPWASLADAKPLFGFDYGADLFHVFLFDLGDEGGAVGIWREGDEFCARISLDSLAEFWGHAKAADAFFKVTGAVS